MKKLKIIIPLILCAYLLSYAVCRWRKILVCHHELTINFKEGFIVKRVRPGEGSSSNFIGKFKNIIAKPSYYFYYPLVKSEDYFRN